MIAKGFIMLKNDKKVATFNSVFKNGNIELWCCVHRDVYELRYDVQFYTPDGLTDAIELANTPLLERD